MCQTVMKAKAPPDLYKHDCASLLVYLSIILLVYLYLILHPPPKAKIRDVKAGGKGNVSLDAKGLCNTRVATVLVLLVLGLGPVFTDFHTISRLHLSGLTMPGMPPPMPTADALPVVSRTCGSLCNTRDVTSTKIVSVTHLLSVLTRSFQFQ